MSPPASSMGFDPLALAAPDLYAKQIGISRRQALGQALLQGGGAEANGAFGGLRNAGNSILGALLLKNADKDMAGLYAPPQDPPGAITDHWGFDGNGNVVSPSGQGLPSGYGGATGATDEEGNPIQAQVMAPQQQAQAQPQQGQAQQRPRSIPEALASMVVPIPGMSKQASVQYFLTDRAGYYKALAAAVSPTEAQKDYNAAYPGDPGAAQQGLQGLLTHNRTLNFRPGAYAQDPGTGQGFGVPDSHGMAPVMGANGQMGMQLVPGAGQALAGSAAATGFGQRQVTPATGYDGNGNPIPSNQADLYGLPGPGAPMGIRTNNPGNLQPGGRQATYGTPAEGILAAASNLDSYAARGINTVQGIVSTWAPAAGGNNPQAYANFVAQKLGVSPNQPLDLKNPAVKGRVLDAMFAFENGPKAMQAAGAPAPQRLSPELPAGQGDFMKGGAHTAVNMREQNTIAAEEVPTRINVLDSISQLVNSGAPVGSLDWQNSARHVAAALQQSLGHPITADNPAALMGEIQKYMGQYQLRMAKIQGGTGTDKQLEAVQHANPNDQMFPTTLKRVVSWLKANEQGAFAKANAQEAFLSQHGQTPQAQLQFEQVWRNAYDPRAFQLQNMQPQEQAAFVKSLSPADARTLLQKRQALKAMGALQ